MCGRCFPFYTAAPQSSTRKHRHCNRHRTPPPLPPPPPPSTQNRHIMTCKTWNSISNDGIQSEETEHKIMCNMCVEPNNGWNCIFGFNRMVVENGNAQQHPVTALATHTHTRTEREKRERDSGTLNIISIVLSKTLLWHNVCIYIVLSCLSLFYSHSFYSCLNQHHTPTHLPLSLCLDFFFFSNFLPLFLFNFVIDFTKVAQQGRFDTNWIAWVKKRERASRESQMDTASQKG